MERHVVPNSSGIFNCTGMHRVRVHPDILPPYSAIFAIVQRKSNTSIGEFLFIYRVTANFAIALSIGFYVEVITVYDTTSIVLTTITSIQNKAVPHLAIDISDIIAVHNTDSFIIGISDQSGCTVLGIHSANVIAIFHEQI